MRRKLRQDAQKRQAEAQTARAEQAPLADTREPQGSSAEAGATADKQVQSEALAATAGKPEEDQERDQQEEEHDKAVKGFLGLGMLACGDTLWDTLADEGDGIQVSALHLWDLEDGKNALFNRLSA